MNSEVTMASKRRNLSQTALLALFILMVAVVPAFAANVVGTVTHLSGPLFARKADGSMKTLSQKSAVEEGDILVTEKRTYGRVKFKDNSEITLRPNTNLKIEEYFHEEGSPGSDKAAFNLIKGSLRSITGQIGKRGNKDSYKMKTPSATIGIRGTTYDLRVCEGNCAGLGDGVYFHVLDGAIKVTTEAGSVVFSSGQYGYVRNMNELPVLLPNNPGLKFDLPPIEKTGCGVR